ncbi:hypothetical protein [Oceanispirochaeta sp.]|jgi:hypothetical protein|uniref:hypothetical protein n=1 Tax=Oceanispirochaeta sp. TaxID=2035350 RepID=UPI002634BB91|nr:hypothetical protein [Oceanispirochaeta sp.]MDA3957198.1 hypothetical protein [Oceanispirochaeta sp.]
MTSQELKNLNDFILQSIQATPFGEIHIVIKTHDNKPVLLETSVITRKKLTGNPGGSYVKSA